MTAPSFSPSAARCSCPGCVAEAALLLLDTGRTAMARTVLADLPAAVRAAVAEAYAEGTEHGIEAARKARPASARLPAGGPRRLVAGQDDPAHDARGNDGADEDERQDGHGSPPSRSAITNGRALDSLPSRPVRRPRPKPPERSARPAKRSATNGPSAPAFPKLAAKLAGHVEHLGADQVAAVLGVALDELGPLLEGRVAPPPGRMRRLRETTE